MKTRLLFTFLLLALGFVSCKKDDGGVVTPPVVQEDWTFPSDASTKLAIYSEKSTVAVGETFDVKIILYNVTGIFGAATEISYASDKVEVLDVLTGPLFTPEAQYLVVKKNEATRNTVSFGITYKNGSGLAVTGSGILLKLKCKGKAAGVGTFTFVAPEARRADGTLVTPAIGSALNITVH